MVGDRLIVALYRTGRQVDALAAYQRLRSALGSELGVDTSPELRALETAILRHDPALRHEPEAPARGVVPAQLPAPATAFTGRLAHLARLDALPAGPGLSIVVIAGIAGSGKTATAVHWAHRVRDRYPDGQLFVDLQGYTGGPAVRPIDALAGFLGALGVPPQQTPLRLDQAAALYRTLVAGRRLLIVLDNARDAEQVRPLLPGEPGCLVLVTSRDRLGGLVARDGALPLPLDTLDPAESHELVTRLLGGERVAAEPAASVELARACGHLPLALRIAAAALLWQPDRPIAGMVDRLRADSLSALAVDGDPKAGISAAFDASYRILPEPARRLFRLLSLVPGRQVSTAAARAMAGPTAAESLGRLTAAHLLVQVGERYLRHDLVRAYAAQRNAREDTAAVRATAERRLYDWCLGIVDAAATLLYPHMLRLPWTVAGARPSFADHRAANAWLDAERADLIAAVRHCATSDDDLRRVACLLADGLRGYFHLRRNVADWRVVGEAALAAARGDRHAQVAAHHSLGTAYRCAADLDAALGHYAEALRLSRAACWSEAEATALGNLGIVCHGQGRLAEAALLRGDHREARRHADAALRRATWSGYRILHGTARLLAARIHLALGDAREAATQVRHALTIHRDIGHRDGESRATRLLAELETR